MSVKWATPVGPCTIRSHGGFELVVDRVVLCCGFLLTCNVISLIVVHYIHLLVVEWLYIPDR